MDWACKKTGEWHWATDLRCPANTEPGKEKSIPKHMVKLLVQNQIKIYKLLGGDGLFSKEQKLDWQLTT